MKLTYLNPQTLYERAVTSCESKIIDLERRQEIKDSEKRARQIELQKYLLRAVEYWNGSAEAYELICGKQADRIGDMICTSCGCIVKPPILHIDHEGEPVCEECWESYCDYFNDEK